MRYTLASLDLWILIAVLGLAAVGLMANFSTSYAEGELEFTHFYRQLIWSAIGLVLMMSAITIPSKYYQTFAYAAYLLGILGLIAVLVIGQSGMGAKRWIGLGIFQFQASEIAKLTTLLGVARFLSDFPRDRDKIWVTLTAVGLTVLPMGLVLVEPDLGTSMVYPMMLFCVLAWSGAPLWHLLLLLCPIVAVVTSWNTTLYVVTLVAMLIIIFLSSKRFIPVILAAGILVVIGSATPILWNKLHPYQQKRLITFVDPESDPLGSAYQLIQSKIAVGSGGLTGKGFLNGTQTQLKFLPEGHTDFIFSAWGEEFGFIGTSGVVVLFLVLFYRGIRLASKCHNPFFAITAAGIVSMLVAQALTNLFMTVGLLPVTGVPLPFISYGGSSLLTWMMISGVLLGISLRWRDY
ncbi:rod shape-determining protein RodA [candidate division KSB1 bacterium]|nr:MAG: rod shape-determining protein RodA [candidate division KSB1 bacterium]